MKAALALAVVLALAGPARADAKLCVESGLCQGEQLPKGTTALGVAEDWLWAVGAKGQLWSRAWDGTFTPVKHKNKQALRAVTAVGDSVVAVGAKGTILRVVSGQVEVVKTKVKKDLHGLWAASERAAWAVGKAGTILYYDGLSWSPEASGTKVDLYAVWGSREGDVWAVGAKGTVLHHNGTAWTTARTGNSRLLAVRGTGPNDVWVVGELGAALYWNGKGWFTIATGVASDLSALVVYDSEGVMLAGGEGSLAKKDGDRWESIAAGEDNFIGSLIWNGIAILYTDSGMTWEYAGGWTENPSPTGESGMGQGIVSMGDDVITGDEEGGLAWRKNGVWTVVNKPDSKGKLGSLLGFYRDGQKLWAVDRGGDALEISTGKPGVFKKDLIPQPSTVEHMWLSGTTGFAVGNHGYLSRWDGKVWKNQEAVTKANLMGVSGAAPDAVWAVGESGTILFWDGSKWTQQPSGVTDSLEVVYAVSKDFAIAAGGWGAVTIFSNGTWGKIDTLPLKASFRAVCGRGDQIVLGSNYGMIAFYDGKRWWLKPTPTEHAILGCTITESGEVLATVQQGGLLSRPPRIAKK